MNTHSEYIDELIVKVLSNTATQKEIVALIDWRTLSDDNERYYAEMLFIYENAAKVTSKQNVDVDAAWKKVQQGIHKNEAKIVPIYPVKTSNALMKWAVAASLTGIIAFATIFWYSSKPEAYMANATTQSLKLNDGSEVALLPKSNLEPIEGKTREYTLNGEAEFKVKHDDANPFIIHTEDALIKDLGTVFKVKYLPKNDTIKVNVTEGLVQFYSPTDDGIQLTEGESGYYLRSTKRFFKYLANDITVSRASFMFEDKSLEEVVNQLNQKFNTKIVIGSEVIKNCKINATFPNATKDEILDVISETLGLWKIEKDGIITLGGKGC